MRVTWGTLFDYFIGLLVMLVLPFLLLGGWLMAALVFLFGLLLPLFAPILLGIFLLMMLWELIKDVARALAGR